MTTKLGPKVQKKKQTTIITPHLAMPFIFAASGRKCNFGYINMLTWAETCYFTDFLF